MKTVAFYGFAEISRDGIWESKADEVWSVIWAYKYDIPRLDRIFEMHPVWLQARSQKVEYGKVRAHWEWLKQNVTIPIYMLIQHPEVPMCVKYPIRQVWDLLPQRRKFNVFTSSFDYMCSLAILEGFERIELYGFEMGSDTEYRYQREGAAYWIGQADARGIELVLPSQTALLRKKMYGYEGGSMIYRQDLERMRETRERQKTDAYALLAKYEGEMKQQLVINGNDGDDPVFTELRDKWDAQYRLCLVISGALQECEYYIKEIDLEEPSVELEDPIHWVREEV